MKFSAGRLAIIAVAAVVLFVIDRVALPYANISSERVVVHQMDNTDAATAAVAYAGYNGTLVHLICVAALVCIALFVLFKKTPKSGA